MKNLKSSISTNRYPSIHRQNFVIKELLKTENNKVSVKLLNLALGEDFATKPLLEMCSNLYNDRVSYSLP